MYFAIPYSRKFLVILAVVIGITTLLLMLLKPNTTNKVNIKRVPLYKLIIIIATNVIIGTQGYNLYKMSLVDMQQAGLAYSRSLNSPNMMVFCITLYLFMCNLLNCYTLISGAYDEDIRLLPVFVMLFQIIAYLVVLSAMLINGFTWL